MNNYSVPAYNEPNIPVGEEKNAERGLFSTARETWECLLDICRMLDDFSNEIEVRPEGDISKRQDPESFADTIRQNNDLAFAIRGDLYRLIEKFRG